MEKNGFYRRMETRCRSTRIRVVKTIRLDMTELQNILESLPATGTVNRHNLRVIYLARDPRGILNSVRTLPSQWPPRLLSAHHICSRLLNDSVQQSRQNLSQLIVLKYEDLALHPADQLAEVEEKFNITLDSRETQNFLKEHSSNSNNWISKDFRYGKWSRAKKKENPENEVLMEIARRKEELEEDVIVEKEQVEVAEDSGGVDYYDDKGKLATVKRRRRRAAEVRRRRPRLKGDKDPQGRSFYYSTYRGADFSPDHWRTQLPKAKLAEVTRSPACRTVIQALGYPDS